MSNLSQTSINDEGFPGLQNNSLFLLLQMVPSLPPTLQDPFLATAN